MEMENQMNKNAIQKEGLIGLQNPKNEYDSALATVDMEARKDKSGNVTVYNLPSGDMGGSYEVAGINDKYHPAAAEMLKNLPAGERRDAAARYVVEYTKPFTSKLPEPYRPFFQDLAFNRGVGGATKFLQRAIGVKDDGALGPQTLKALEGLNPSEVMRNVSVEQMTYERRLAEQNPERKKFLNGLQNRVSNRYRLFGNAPTG
jgi:lysozyme family protein